MRGEKWLPMASRSLNNPDISHRSSIGWSSEYESFLYLVLSRPVVRSAMINEYTVLFQIVYMTLNASLDLFCFEPDADWTISDWTKGGLVEMRFGRALGWTESRFLDTFRFGRVFFWTSFPLAG
jgi:hypothetical protein